MLQIKNCLFQPLTLHLADGRETVHLLSRATTQILDNQMSEEIRCAEKKGFVKVSIIEQKPVAVPADRKGGRKR